MGQLKDLEAVMAEHVGMKRVHQSEKRWSVPPEYFVPMLLVRFAKLYRVDITLSIDNRENILGMLAQRSRSGGDGPGTQDPGLRSNLLCHQPLSIVAAPAATHSPAQASAVRHSVNTACGAQANSVHAPCSACFAKRRGNEGCDGNAQQRDHQTGCDGRHGPELPCLCAPSGTSWPAGTLRCWM